MEKSLALISISLNATCTVHRTKDVFELGSTNASKLFADSNVTTENKTVGQHNREYLHELLDEWIDNLKD
jgi:hypothetical protein